MSKLSDVTGAIGLFFEDLSAAIVSRLEKLDDDLTPELSAEDDGVPYPQEDFAKLLANQPEGYPKYLGDFSEYAGPDDVVIELTLEEEAAVLDLLRARGVNFVVASDGVAEQKIRKIVPDTGIHVGQVFPTDHTDQVWTAQPGWPVQPVGPVDPDVQEALDELEWFEQNDETLEALEALELLFRKTQKVATRPNRLLMESAKLILEATTHLEAAGQAQLELDKLGEDIALLQSHLVD